MSFLGFLGSLAAPIIYYSHLMGRGLYATLPVYLVAATVATRWSYSISNESPKCWDYHA